MTKPRPRLSKFRHHCITTFNTKCYKVWKSLDLSDLQIRCATFQLETTKAGKVHVQGYFEFYDQLRITQVKDRLQDNSLHSEKRKGTRAEARDYCLKDDTPFFRVNYPHWESHGVRIPGTEPVQLGKFQQNQGHRTDLDQVIDAINSNKSEAEIYESCPSQYLKYSTGIRRARNLSRRSTLNEYFPVEVHVIWGDTRSGKTRAVFDKFGPQNVYCPVYSQSAGKFWFQDYDGQKVLLINEFYGQARTSIMQQLLDHYRQAIETKGDSTISAWDKIYITSNCHPRDWYSKWENIPQKVQDSFIERITTISFRASRKTTKTWDDISDSVVEATVLPSTTSEPRTPEKKSSFQFEFTASASNWDYATPLQKELPFPSWPLETTKARNWDCSENR